MTLFFVGKSFYISNLFYTCTCSGHKFCNQRSITLIIKKNDFMKKYSLLFLMALSLWAFQACNDGVEDEDTVENANEMNEMKDEGEMGESDQSTLGVTENESEFMVKAAAGGMAEVELAKLAQQKATNANVKSFANMIVTDHTKANEELKALAATKNVTLPASISEDHQKHMNELTEKTGRDFDDAYIDMMVDDHQEDVDLFDKWSEKDDASAEVKAFAAKTLPTLRMHLEEAKKLDDSMKK